MKQNIKLNIPSVEINEQVFLSEKDVKNYLHSIGFNQYGNSWINGLKNAIILPTKAYKVYFFTN